MSRARWALALAVAGGCSLAPHGTLYRDEVFTAYSPLSRDVEMMRRILTPLGFRRGQEVLASRGEAFAEQDIDLRREHFTIYVPPGPPPPAGYGLLVFVSPADQALEPRRWRHTLDGHGVIVVSASRAGNSSKVYERRVPLTLLAYENVRARFPVDPARVWVGGLSGGARVAEAVALAYPDVFHGLLMNAGSQPIGGERGIYLPARELFEQFQRTRVVYVTGGEDEGNLTDDGISRKAMRDWCVLDVEVIVPPRAGHELLDAAALDRALTFLDGPSRTDPGQLVACNAGIDQALAARLAEVEAAVGAGDRAGARARLDAADRFFGGLGAPATLELDDRVSRMAAAP